MYDVNTMNNGEVVILDYARKAYFITKQEYDSQLLEFEIRGNAEILNTSNNRYNLFTNANMLNNFNIIKTNDYQIRIFNRINGIEADDYVKNNILEFISKNEVDVVAKFNSKDIRYYLDNEFKRRVTTEVKYAFRRALIMILASMNYYISPVYEDAVNDLDLISILEYFVELFRNMLPNLSRKKFNYLILKIIYGKLKSHFGSNSRCIAFKDSYLTPIKFMLSDVNILSTIEAYDDSLEFSFINRFYKRCSDHHKLDLFDKFTLYLESLESELDGRMKGFLDKIKIEFIEDGHSYNGYLVKNIDNAKLGSNIFY